MCLLILHRFVQYARVQLLLYFSVLLFACGGADQDTDSSSSSSSIAVNSSVSSASSSSLDSSSSALSSSSLSSSSQSSNSEGSSSSTVSSSSVGMSSSGLVVGQNKLSSDGSFSNGAGSFVGFTESDGVSYATVTFEAGLAEFVIQTASVDAWRVQLLHDVSIEEGVQYTICYDAKADDARLFNVNVDTSAPEYASLMGEGIDVALSTAMQSFSHTFIATDTDLGARLNISMAQAAINVQLDNVGIFEGENCPSEFPRSGPDKFNGEVLYKSESLDCGACHGDMLYDGPSTGNNVIEPENLPENLVDYIAENMPKNNAGICVDECAEDVAAYLESFKLIPEVFGKPYRGAEIYSRERMLYGRFVIRMMAARASGVISNFFTYKDGSQEAGTFWEEIDIEIFGKENAQGWQSNIITGDGSVGGLDLSEGHHYSDASFADEYNTFAIEWAPNYVAWYVNGEEIRRDTQSNFQVATLVSPQDVRLNFWQPDVPTWVGPFDPSVLPLHMYVNWVEYYSWNNGDFSLEWRDDFNDLDLSRWQRANWSFDLNNSDFTRENINVVDGKLILSLTWPDDMGFDGQPPADVED